MRSETELRVYFDRVKARELLVTHACYRLSDKRKDVGLTPEEEVAASALSFARTHLSAENLALAYILFSMPEPVPNGSLAQVLTALGDDQYQGKGGPLSPTQLAVAELASYQRKEQPWAFIPEAGEQPKQLGLFEE